MGSGRPATMYSADGAHETQRGLALVHPLRDAREPSVVRGDDVALLLVSQAVGVRKRAERGTHFLQGLRGRSALCTSPAAIPAFEAASGEQSSTLRPPLAAGSGCFLWDGRRESRAQSVRSFRVRKQTPGFSGGKHWKSQKLIRVSPNVRSHVKCVRAGVGTEVRTPVQRERDTPVTLATSATTRA